LPVIYVHRQSAYLIGRDHKVADFPIDHPSCSKQHAALQYRSMPFERADGSKGRVWFWKYFLKINFYFFKEDIYFG